MRTCFRCGNHEADTQPFVTRIPSPPYGKLIEAHICRNCIDIVTHAIPGRTVGYCVQCKKTVGSQKFVVGRSWSYVLCDGCTHPDNPIVCDGCETEMDPDSAILFPRGNVCCEECEYDTAYCSNPQCNAALLITAGNGFTAAGNNYYCSRDHATCHQVAHVPTWFPTSLDEWEFRPNCPCNACKFLRNKNDDRWPVDGDVAYVIFDDYGQAVNDGDFIYCYKCDQPFYDDYLEDVDSRDGAVHVCHLCYVRNCVTCPECDKHIFQREHNTDGDWCQECMENSGNFWYCEYQCKAWFAIDVPCNCEGIHRWNYKPATWTPYTAHGENYIPEIHPLIGIELEVELQLPDGLPGKRKAGLTFLKDTLSDFAHPMHDGSLSGGGDDGFEIVTSPFTFEWFKDNWPKFVDLLVGLKKLHYHTSSRCGMHIHVSRRPMSDLHAMKFIQFVYGSSNLALCIGQRGRSSNGIKQYACFDSERHDRMVDKVRGHNPGINTHFAALNTLTPTTIEARWFAGTLTPKHFRKNVEFIHAAYQFTSKFGLTSANEMNFIEWLRQTPERREYSVLLDYIENNYITRPWKGVGKGGKR